MSDCSARGRIRKESQLKTNDEGEKKQYHIDKSTCIEC